MNLCWQMRCCWWQTGWGDPSTSNRCSNPSTSRSRMPSWPCRKTACKSQPRYCGPQLLPQLWCASGLISWSHSECGPSLTPMIPTGSYPCLPCVGNLFNPSLFRTASLLKSIIFIISATRCCLRWFINITVIWKEKNPNLPLHSAASDLYKTPLTFE